MKLVEGKEIEVMGLITRSYSIKGRYNYGFTDGKDSTEIMTDRVIATGAIVNVKGIVENWFGVLKIKAESVELNEELDAYSKLEKNAEENVKLKDVPFLSNDQMMKDLRERIDNIAKKIYVAQKLGRFIILRFHGDGDGIGGALALTHILKAKTIQQNSAVYRVKEAMEDINNCTHQNKPLVILLDFGSNNESKDGLELLKASKIEAISIDHHPHSENIIKYFSEMVNGWLIENEESSSKYTAGYLAAEIARRTGADVDEYARICVASDKSDIIDVNDEDKNKSIVLNYTATYSSYGNKLEFYASVLANPDLFQSILNQAKERMEEIIRVSEKNLKKKEVNGINVYWVNIGDIAKKYEFPSLGKGTTMISENIKDENFILLGYGTRSVMFRISEGASKKGIDSIKIIEKLKENMNDFVESGGGHSRAAAVRVREGYEKNVIEEIIRILE